ncbi:hypothetical protein EHW97_00445 [Aeromicrobium camelliae]|uniref:Uncharacterized protein n=1 Tax=Aeromicrobium camelliae TaxID=1538144 RepID=A0A3N6X8M8_9ACTN|nr:hypothetical protein [Aeromicrobium camelliae]RQN10003.1 hypothetical protein EHW97_00445 [Aeromicrobium camelliae]
MKRRLMVTAGVSAALLALTACDSGSTTPAPSATPTAVATADDAPVDSHESGLESPIVFGLTVPRGAVQLGPLVQVRSQELLDTYRPELEALLAEQAAEEAAEQEAEAAENEGEPTEEATPSPTPTPTPTDIRPERDTFAPLEEPPLPDTVTSVMRIDDEPSEVTRTMLAQIAALLPEEEIVTDDLSTYCDSENDRVTHCALDVTGTTPGDREVRVQLDIDPGELATRTANAYAQEKPVMVLTVTYVGDPREGQENREPEQLDEIDPVDTPEKSGLIWPKMDLDAPGEGPFLGDWTPPEDGRVLLTGHDPAFVLVYTQRSTEGAQIARDYVAAKTGVEEPVRDVVAYLNEVNAVYSAQAPDGTTARAVHVVTARGSYTFLFSLPPA